MSTRCRIGMKLADGTFRSIYCHFDGYEDGVGKTLLEHYTNEAKIVALLDLGDISALAAGIGEKHDFNTHNVEHPDWTLAYKRDRGEDGTEADVCTEISGVQSEEYAYVWMNGVWYTADGHDDFRPLAPVVKVPETVPAPYPPLTTGPEYFDTITTRTTLTSSQALVSLTALRHYRAWLESDATREWPRVRLSDWHREVNEAIEAIEKAGHDAG